MAISVRIQQWFATALLLGSALRLLGTDAAASTNLGWVPEDIGLEKQIFDSGSCDWVAQALLFSPLLMTTIDIVIQNFGGCDSGINQGNFTVEDVHNLLPYDQKMVRIEMTGAQIKNVLEDAIDFYLDRNATLSWNAWAYPKASGIRFDVNAGLPKDERILNLEVLLAGAWEAMEMSATYRVGTTEFLADYNPDFSNGYDEFGNIDESSIEYTGISQTEAVIEFALYLKAMNEVNPDVGKLEPVAEDRRSTQNWIETDPPTTAPSSSPSTNAPTEFPTKTPSLAPSAACSCQPSEYKFKLDLSRTCEDQTIDYPSDAINFTQCSETRMRNGNPDAEHLVPEAMTSMVIAEYEDYSEGVGRRIISSKNVIAGNCHDGELADDDDLDHWCEEYQEGGTFSFTPKEASSKALVFKIFAKNQYGEILYKEFYIEFNDFNAGCAHDSHLEAGDTIGWVEIVDVGLPSDDCLCGGEADDPDFQANGRVNRDCAWIAEKPEKRCPLDDEALEKCPSACTPSCHKSASPSESPSQAPSIAPSELPSSAPSDIPSVDFCGGGADNPDFKANGFDKRTCSWIAKLPPKRCYVDEEAFDECPSICNPVCAST